MAMARAGKGTGLTAEAATAVEEKPAPKPTEKPAAKPAPKAKPETAPTAGGPKDTASILAAARKAAKPGPITKAAAAPRAAVATAVAEPKEAVKKGKADGPADAGQAGVRQEAGRPRPSETKIAAAFLAADAGLGAGIGLHVAGRDRRAVDARHCAGSCSPTSSPSRPAGSKSAFPTTFAPGQVETKFMAQFGVWVVQLRVQRPAADLRPARRSARTWAARPTGSKAEQKFKCPCHGSGFYKDGINFEGPAPRPLERYAIRLADDGQLEVDKSKMFQEELGQWNDPARSCPCDVESRI